MPFINRKPSLPLRDQSIANRELALTGVPVRLLTTIPAAMVMALVAQPSYASEAYGEPFTGSGFQKDDWQLVCDNTMTCRAAGYGDEYVSSKEGNTHNASLLVTLAAGSKTPEVQLRLSQWGDEEQEALVDKQLAKTGYRVELWLNDKSYGQLKLSKDRLGKLTAAQAQALIGQAQKDTLIRFQSGSHSWLVSDKGMAAILLKLDEAQGRVGTPMALVAKKSATRQTPKAAKPVPKIYAVSPYSKTSYPTYELAENGQSQPPKNQKYPPNSTAQQRKYWQANLNKWIGSTLGEEEQDSCYLLNSDEDYAQNYAGWSLTPLDAKHTMVSHNCWSGAYNFGAGVWVINHDRPEKPQLITTDSSDYGDGEIYAAHKGRGLGDCWGTQHWVWTGKTFTKTSDLTTGMCRGIQPGGAWDLPTYVSEVIAPKAKTK
jgi:hypothetical protein